MLFNSYEFLLLFLPAALLAYLLLGTSVARRAAILAAASLAFYASWNPAFLTLLLGSAATNYGLGVGLQRAMQAGRTRRADLVAGAGIALNLAVLGIFKYAGFAVDNVNALTGAGFVIGHIVLPLGLSFFTFEQIGFLVDLRRSAPYRLDPLRYLVFVSFFPRLVAGPILRYNEIVPQLEQESTARNATADLAIGLGIFSVGLVKKAFLADGIAPFAAAPFAAAASGQPLDLFAAWGGALAYACQLYFDFSGYSDMAIGAARCFGIRFPENFDSPYKSASIIEFWRRWHITLSRFLRDYLYVPLGGNRRGKARRHANLLMTMLLGGFWHGANWTFVAWGALHGAYLIVNHAWIALAGHSRPVAAFRASRPGRAFGLALTFLAVVVAWVFFRAPTFDAALAVLGAMAGRHGAELPAAIIWNMGPLAPLLAWLEIRSGGGSGSQFMATWLWIAALLPIVFLAPNTRQIAARALLSLEPPAPPASRLRRMAWAIGAGAAAFLGFISITRASVFLYWQF